MTHLSPQHPRLFLAVDTNHHVYRCRLPLDRRYFSRQGVWYEGKVFSHIY